MTFRDQILPMALLGLLLNINLLSVEAAPPNIVYILCDDLGYGDVGCMSPQCKIPTPHIDRLASEGMIFTDAHSSSSVCTPTRYGVLTGRYNWRTKLQSGVLGGLSPRLIEPGRLTVAEFLKSQGYHTACVGKWHLGMDWAILPGKEISPLNIEPPGQVHNVDYGQPIQNGPNAVGFDYYFGISASLDMVPYTFIENDRVTVLPTEEVKFELFLGDDSRLCRVGPTAPGFHVDQVLPRVTEVGVKYIQDRAAAARAGQPFFLYLPFASPHTPIAPNPEWQGRSGLNFYGDFVMQNDRCVGQVIEAIDAAGLKDNTLIIFTSDNGCSPMAKMDELAAHGHHPSYHLRGHKADLFEGGHRVPFVVRWPARVKAGTVSDQTICLTDLLRTCADITGVALPDNAGEDSVSFLSALTGEARKPLREAVVHHSINGSFSIRQGRWKLLLCPGSGGWSAPRPGRDSESELLGIQLYDLRADIGEQRNLASERTDVVSRLTLLLERYVEQGRSTPGEPQPNAVAITIRRGIPASSQGN